MGYTHYWLPKESTDEKFAKFSAACKYLHDHLPPSTDTAGGYHSEDPLVICGCIGEGAPEFTSEMVSFNGDATDNLDHECFEVTKDNLEWDFCKTDRKPYDLLVVACLLAAVDFLDYRFSSDGFTDYTPPGGEHIKNVDDLLPGLEFYNNVMQTEYDEDHLWKIREDYYLLRDGKEIKHVHLTTSSVEK